MKEQGNRIPSTYSEEKANEILERIMAGEMLMKICQEPGMPPRRMVYSWMEASSSFKEAYARARLAWADWWAEKVLEVSFDDAGDIFIEDGKAVADHARIQRHRLQVDTAKWLVGKYAPRTYGDKPDLQAVDAGNLTISWQAGPPPPPPPAPAQLAYDPGPLPKRIDPEILTRLVQIIKDRVPKADQRDPVAVLDEVMGVIDRALAAEYGPVVDG